MESRCMSYIRIQRRTKKKEKSRNMWRWRFLKSSSIICSQMRSKTHKLMSLRETGMKGLSMYKHDLNSYLTSLPIHFLK